MEKRSEVAICSSLSFFLTIAREQASKQGELFSFCKSAPQGQPNCYCANFCSKCSRSFNLISNKSLTSYLIMINSFCFVQLCNIFSTSSLNSRQLFPQGTSSKLSHTSSNTHQSCPQQPVPRGKNVSRK